MERIAEILIRYRRAWLLLIIIFSSFFAYQFRFFSVRSSIDESLPQSDPRIRFYEKFTHEFENPDLILIGLKDDDVFSKENLERIDRLTRRVQAVSDVSRVTSIINVPAIRGTEEGIEISPFLESIPSSPLELTNYRNLALNNPRYVNNLLSAEGTFASINVQLGSHHENSKFRYRVTRDIRRILDQDCPQCYLTGLSAIAEDSLQSILKDLRTYIWLTPVLISVLLCLFFRSLRGFLVPQGVVLLSVIWTLGLFFACRRSFAMITTMLPVLISMICLSDVIHILSRYYEEAGRSEDKGLVLKKTFLHMVLPCFLTSTTTAIGFGSLMMNEIEQIREFGLFSFPGILGVYLLAMSLTPVLLAFLPLPNSPVERRDPSGLVSRLLIKAHELVENRKRETLLVLGVLSVIAIVGIFQIRIETQTSRFLDPQAPSIQGLRAFGENLSGIITVEVLLEGEREVFKEPWALKELDRFQQHLGKMGGVQKTHSMAGLIKEINSTLNPGDAPSYSIPQRRDQVAQCLLLLELSDEQALLSRFVNDDFSTARLSVRVASMSTADYRILIDKIKQAAPAHFSPSLTVRCTGTVALYATIVDALTKGQIRSLGLAFLVITLLMTVYMRSLRIGLISMIPNLYPVLLILGLMGWVGITLNIVTVMISSIALGMAVDDTIHYLARYRKERNKTVDASEAMRQTMLHTGRAIVFTSIVLTGGFLIICLSDFRPNIYLGLLTSVAMISALLGDLLLLPICIQIFTKWK